MVQNAARSEASLPNSLGPRWDWLDVRGEVLRPRTALSWLLARWVVGESEEAGCRTRLWAQVHRDRSLHLGNARVPPGSPAVEGSEDGGNGRALLAMKGAIHDYVSSSCTSGKKGTGAERGCEPRPAPRNQSSSREGSGLGGLLTSSLIHTAARASMALSSGSGAVVATTRSTRTRKYDHISPVLSTLHWLPIKHCIDFKILLIIHKALNGLAPQYLSELLSQYSPPRPLRSQNSGHLIISRI